MTSRELVKAAIGHLPTPRTPSMIWLAGEMYNTLEAKYGDVTEYLGNDVIFVHAPWWNWSGLASDWQGDLPPKSPAEVVGYGSYEEFYQQVAEAKRKDKYILAPIWGGHFEKAYFARGFENFLADLAGEKIFAQNLLDDIIRRNLVMLENILQHPDIDGVLLGSDWGSQLDLLMSLDTWNELIRPGEQAEYDLIHRYGKDVWVHSCGNITKLLPTLIEMGVDVLNPLQPECMDNQEMKQLYGAKIAFWCGVGTQQTLPYGSPEEVYQEAKAVKKRMGENGGFIFSSSQFIQDDVPLENLDMLVKVAKEMN